MTTSPSPVLIDSDELNTLISRDGTTGGPLRVIDLRWSPTGPPARPKYDAGHIPGAVFVDMEDQLSHPQKAGPGGRHRLISPEEFAQLLAKLGISESTYVVVYDDGTGSIAARLWFHLKLHGHPRTSILNGGIAAWTAAGLPLDKSAPEIAPAPLRKLVRDDSRIVFRPRIAELVAHRRDAGPHAPLLLDARAPERYRGDVEPLDRAGGHIPGAINVPVASLLRGNGDLRFRPLDEVRGILQKAGVPLEDPGAREVIASCGSGVTACHLMAAMEMAGFTNAKIYSGSYSDWVSDPNAEVTKGSEP